MLENVSCARSVLARRLKRFTKFDLSIGRCGQCGFVYANPLPRNRKLTTIRLFLAGISSFIGCAGKKRQRVFDARHAAMLNLIASYIQPPGSCWKSEQEQLLPEGSWAMLRLGCRDWSIWSRCSICTNWVGFGCKTTSSWKITLTRLFWCSSYVWCSWTLIWSNRALSSIRGVLRSEDY